MDRILSRKVLLIWALIPSCAIAQTADLELPSGTFNLEYVCRQTLEGNTIMERQGSELVPKEYTALTMTLDEQSTKALKKQKRLKKKAKKSNSKTKAKRFRKKAKVQKKRVQDIQALKAYVQACDQENVYSDNDLACKVLSDYTTGSTSSSRVSLASKCSGATPVVEILVFSGGIRVKTCSGVSVSGGVITTASCLENDSTQSGISDITVINDNGSLTPAPHTTTYTIHPDFDKNDTSLETGNTNDIAVITFPTNPNFPTAELYDPANDSLDENFTLFAGFGTGSDGSSGYLNATFLGQYDENYSNFNIVGIDDSTSTLYNSGVPQDGDDGGPFFVRDANGAWKVVGVITAVVETSPTTTVYAGPSVVANAAFLSTALSIN